MKKILSIDGGGIRGIIPALVLAAIEMRTGKPVAQCFDLIAGTSTGGIVALGLGVDAETFRPRYSAQELADLYAKRGKDIFDRSLAKKCASLGGWADEMYSAAGLESVLNEYFGDYLLGQALTPTMVTCYDIQRRSTVFLKSWHDDYYGVRMKHAARATSAAPTYFEPALIPIGESWHSLVDGGIFINSPSVSAYAEAKRLFPEENDFFVLSLGTGEQTRPIDHGKAKNWGKVEWASPLIECMFDGMADAADYQMRMLLGSQYVRMQAVLTKASDAMDDAGAKNIQLLRAEAEDLIRNREEDIKAICALLVR